MPTHHTDQFEEIVNAWNEETYLRSAEATNDEIAEWWLWKLHHIRRETEKGMMEKVKALPSITLPRSNAEIVLGKEEYLKTIQSFEGVELVKKDDVLVLLESDNSPQS